MRNTTIPTLDRRLECVRHSTTPPPINWHHVKTSWWCGSNLFKRIRRLRVNIAQGNLHFTVEIRSDSKSPALPYPSALGWHWLLFFKTSILTTKLLQQGWTSGHFQDPGIAWIPQGLHCPAQSTGSTIKWYYKNPTCIHQCQVLMLNNLTLFCSYTPVVSSVGKHHTGCEGISSVCQRSLRFYWALFNDVEYCWAGCGGASVIKNHFRGRKTGCVIRHCGYVLRSALFFPAHV